MTDEFLSFLITGINQNNKGPHFAYRVNHDGNNVWPPGCRETGALIHNQ